MFKWLKNLIRRWFMESPVEQAMKYVPVRADACYEIDLLENGGARLSRDGVELMTFIGWNWK